MLFGFELVVWHATGNIAAQQNFDSAIHKSKYPQQPRLMRGVVLEYMKIHQVNTTATSDGKCGCFPRASAIHSNPQAHDLSTED